MNEKLLRRQRSVQAKLDQRLKNIRSWEPITFKQGELDDMAQLVEEAELEEQLATFDKLMWEVKDGE